jgi:predicted  nucleic acid-binding Zn-ribbon protein
VNIGRQLYDLQQITLDLDNKAAELQELEKQINESKVLVEAQAELEEAKNRLTKLEKEQKEAEWKLDDLQAKCKPLQAKLAAGSAHPKELLSFKQQLDSFTPQVDKVEDSILEIMSRTEGVQKDIAAKTARVKKLEQEWKTIRKELLVKQKELTAAMDAGSKKRDELVVSMDSSHLELYELLRAQQNQPVARIEQGRCQGCRISLPKREMQQARLGALIQCGSCHRILCSS